MIDLEKIRQEELIKKLENLSHGQDDYYLENDEIILLANYIKEQKQMINEADDAIVNYLCTEEYCGLYAPLLPDLFLKIRQMLKKYKGDN